MRTFSQSRPVAQPRVGGVFRLEGAVPPVPSDAADQRLDPTAQRLAVSGRRRPALRTLSQAPEFGTVGVRHGIQNLLGFAPVSRPAERQTTRPVRDREAIAVGLGDVVSLGDEQIARERLREGSDGHGFAVATDDRERVHARSIPQIRRIVKLCT